MPSPPYKSVLIAHMAMQAHRDSVSEFTAPGSFTGPPTPPLTTQKPTTSVVKVLQYIRHQKSGVSQSSWHELKLYSSEYDVFLRLLKKKRWVYVETKVRCDISSTNSVPMCYVVNSSPRRYPEFADQVVWQRSL